MNTAVQKVVAEGMGTAALLVAVVGSGIMGQQLAGGNMGIALLANTLATACALYVLISGLAPISGAHFNPLVSVIALGAAQAVYCITTALYSCAMRGRGAWGVAGTCHV